MTANLLTEVGVDHYRFAHALVRSTLRAESLLLAAPDCIGPWL